ncbi:hypothetical protein [Asticcacaulis machinosus]|uniref:PABS domain-containing protein n=1 Tax=Asticcacaulis machinosus TaxID=2984211 RepID=A0ABT5HMZ5_9CAUL|nr:hypothetical protein [Asticcacaulis machinosus]MDC7677500.1 hypothetical protein [Asticcacaulis machinosus]
MSDNSLSAIQSTSPLAPKSFWCIANTLNASGFINTPYHALVPAFGDWGYVIASRTPYVQPEQYPDGLRPFRTLKPAVINES